MTRNLLLSRAVLAPRRASIPEIHSIVIAAKHAGFGVSTLTLRSLERPRFSLNFSIASTGAADKP